MAGKAILPETHNNLVSDLQKFIFDKLFTSKLDYSRPTEYLNYKNHQSEPKRGFKKNKVQQYSKGK